MVVGFKKFHPEHRLARIGVEYRLHWFIGINPQHWFLGVNRQHRLLRKCGQHHVLCLSLFGDVFAQRLGHAVTS